MAKIVRNIEDAKKRFVRNGTAGAEDYKKNVAMSGEAWKSGATAGKENWNQGVLEAAARDGYGKSVRATDPSYFAQRASQVGGARFAQGVQAGADNWAEGSKPYQDAVSGMTLPAKGPRGAAQNFERAQAVAARQHELRVNRNG